jgi:glycosyltransferase involved in cell wall biosynthesis
MIPTARRGAIICPSMDVGIDCSCVAKPERTGVARYCASLVAALPGAIAPADRVSLLYRVSRWTKREWFERSPDPRFSVGVFHDRVLRFGTGGVDVVHGPDLRIPHVRRVPAVSTVHDLSALDVPGIADAKFQEAKQRALADVAERAAVILCISEFTERALLERFPAARGRTRVVPLGLPPRFGPQTDAGVASVLSRRHLSRGYVLFVGQVAARKNLAPLLAAFGALQARPQFRDLRLVLAGPVRTGGDEIVAAAKSSPQRDAIDFLGFVGDEELPALYAGAGVFAFPGKGEGFGIPILEAMACGTPVVAARAGANPSTAGDAAVLVDPDDADAWAAALEAALTDTSHRNGLADRGRVRASRLSWKETPRRPLDAYPHPPPHRVPP